MKRLTVFFLLLALLLTGCVRLPPETTPAATTADSRDTLQVHFIDVGQADCILLQSAGECMLIDGGNVEDSSLVVSYLQKQGVQELEAVICSHAHEDHVGGLAGVLAVFPVKAVYAPTRTYSSKCFDDFLYYIDQQGLTVTIPSPGDTLSLGAAQGIFLGPVDSYADPNNTSLVLRMELGDHRFLFTGDMETAAENDLLDSGADVKTDVLKVGHHGSYTSSGYRFLYEAAPAFAIISCGLDNDYGHPHEEALSRLLDADAAIYRTDQMGTILAVTDGTKLQFFWENSSAAPEISGQTTENTYIGNKKSKVLHLSTCHSLPSAGNQVFFDSYEQAISAGYTPCSHCMG